MSGNDVNVSTRRYDQCWWPGDFSTELDVTFSKSKTEKGAEGDDDPEEGFGDDHYLLSPFSFLFLSFSS